MSSRSDWEPLPEPTLSPFARGYLSLCRFFTAAVTCVVCACSAGTVGSFSNKPLLPKEPRTTLERSVAVRALSVETPSDRNPYDYVASPK